MTPLAHLRRRWIAARHAISVANRSGDRMCAKKVWLVVWLLAGGYFVVAAAGAGVASIALGSMVCGFMAARNIADLVAGSNINR